MKKITEDFIIVANGFSLYELLYHRHWFVKSAFVSILNESHQRLSNSSHSTHKCPDNNAIHFSFVYQNLTVSHLRILKMSQLALLSFH